jgi:hypothetical protein
MLIRLEFQKLSPEVVGDNLIRIQVKDPFVLPDHGIQSEVPLRREIIKVALENSRSTLSGDLDGLIAASRVHNHHIIAPFQCV